MFLRPPASTTRFSRPMGLPRRLETSTAPVHRAARARDRSSRERGAPDGRHRVRRRPAGAGLASGRASHQASADRRQRERLEALGGREAALSTRRGSDSIGGVVEAVKRALKDA